MGLALPFWAELTLQRPAQGLVRARGAQQARAGANYVVVRARGAHVAARLARQGKLGHRAGGAGHDFAFAVLPSVARRAGRGGGRVVGVVAGATYQALVFLGSGRVPAEFALFAGCRIQTVFSRLIKGKNKRKRTRKRTLRGQKRKEGKR